ncbi:hypothetical protein RB653_006469 [Dictyostelium firmibasis]|uniref:HP domain-containing protein n=1 Tax=Dictyostelium firmibasis TaxID=79012 RepID=A0AAN7YZ46_9MYCE
MNEKKQIKSDNLHQQQHHIKYLNSNFKDVEKNKLLVHIIAGSGSKLTESLIMFPLDTIKTRLQFQGDFSKGSIKNRYSGITNAFLTTIRTEGILSLYRGYIPHTLYVLPASAISFVCYEAIVQEAKKSRKFKNMMFDTSGIKAVKEKSELKMVEEVEKGNSGLGVLLPIIVMTVARITGSVLRTPFDVVKMRQQVSGSLVNEHVKKTNSTAFNSALKIIKTDGVKGLFKYSYVSLLRDLPFTAIYFSTYEFSRNYQKYLINRGRKSGEKKKKLSSINNLISGSLAGALGTTLTIPIDVIKTNLQTQDLLPKDKRVFNGVISAFKYIIKTEGFKGLTKGLSTRLIHVVPSAGISFLKMGQQQSGINTNEVPAVTFSKDTESVEISDRFLVTFPLELNQLLNLKFLNLSRNKIRRLDGVSTILKLEDLDISYNALSIISDDLYQCKSLEKLNLSFNQINNIQSSFIAQLKLLKVLNLSNNILSQLPNEIGFLSNLTILNLSFNKLQQLPKTIGRLSSLQKLIVNNNSLQLLPNEIGDLLELQQLDCAENELRILPTTISNCKSLTKLYLDNNDFLEMISELGNLSKLKELNLRSNQLVDLPSSLSKLVNLQILDLDDNQWEHIDYTVNDIPRLLQYLKNKKDVVNKSRKSTSKEYRRTLTRQKLEDKKRLSINNVFDSFQVVEYKKKLLQLKGINRIIVKRVEIILSSLNNDSVFILDVGKRIYLLMGLTSNQRERQKGLHLCGLLRSESGGVSDLVMVDQKLAKKDELIDFWKEFGGNNSTMLKIKSKGEMSDMEMEEEVIIQTKLFKFYEPEEGRLDIQVHAGVILYKAMLDSNSCAILDTGNDIYVWSGLYSSSNEKSWSMLKAEELITRGKRSEFSEIQWVVEGMETLLFIENFVDWVDNSWDQEYIKTQNIIREHEDQQRQEAERERIRMEREEEEEMQRMNRKSSEQKQLQQQQQQQQPPAAVSFIATSSPSLSVNSPFTIVTPPSSVETPQTPSPISTSGSTVVLPPIKPQTTTTTTTTASLPPTVVLPPINNNNNLSEREKIKEREKEKIRERLKQREASTSSNNLLSPTNTSPLSVLLPPITSISQPSSPVVPKIDKNQSITTTPVVQQPPVSTYKHSFNPVPQKPVEPIVTPVIQKPVEPIVTKPSPTPVVQQPPTSTYKHVFNPVPQQKPAEPVVVQKPVEPIVTPVIQKPVESIVTKPSPTPVVQQPPTSTYKHVFNPVPQQKPAEPVVAQKPVEPVVVQKQPEPVVIQKPTPVVQQQPTSSTYKHVFNPVPQQTTTQSTVTTTVKKPEPVVIQTPSVAVVKPLQPEQQAKKEVKEEATSIITTDESVQMLAPLPEKAEGVKRQAASRNPIRARQERAAQEEADAKKRLEEAAKANASSSSTTTVTNAKPNVQSALGGFGLLYSVGAPDETMFKTRAERIQSAMDSNNSSNPFSLNQQPKDQPKLLHIKGRRSPFVRQVELCYQSLNKGDVFILDCGKDKNLLYQWNGSESNRIEKGKGMDIGKSIKDKERVGCRVIIIDEGKEPEEFWKILGGKGEIASACSAGDDRDAELNIRKYITLYRVQAINGDKELDLTPIEGRLSKSLLEPEECYILDCVSEMFVWTGTNSKLKVRNMTLKMGNEMFAARAANHCWTSGACHREFPGSEQVLFKERFSDWGGSLPIAMQQVPVGLNTATAKKQEKISVDTMHKPKAEKEEVMIDDGSGKLTIWRVEEFQKVQLDPSTYGQFYSGDSYLVLYTYFFKNKDNYLIYFWQGKNSSINEKGTSALLTVELDDSLKGMAKEVRVVQNKEPKHFLSVFKGRFIIHQGKDPLSKNYKPPSNPNEPILYHIRGTTDFNTRAIQSKLSTQTLNSFNSFILNANNTIYIWYGKFSNQLERQFSKNISKSLSGTKLIEIEEGKESEEFFKLLGGRQPYPLSKTTSRVEPRLYHCTVGSGAFVVDEVTSFAQEDLLQEDVFIVDGIEQIFIWIGTETTETERRSSMEIAMEYSSTLQSPRKQNIPVYLTYHGKEPYIFTSLFHGWDFSKRIIPTISLDQELVLAKDILDLYTKKYTYDQLVKKQYPKGIDGSRLEEYLSDEEFFSVFKITLAQFKTLSLWKRESWKKELRLY